VESASRFAPLESPNQIMMENSRFLNQKDVLSVVLAKGIVLLWRYSYKNVKVAVVYGMHVVELKIHRAIAVVVEITNYYFILLFSTI
jgi:hypothetical protein